MNAKSSSSLPDNPVIFSVPLSFIFTIVVVIASLVLVITTEVPINNYEHVQNIFDFFSLRNMKMYDNFPSNGDPVIFDSNYLLALGILAIGVTVLIVKLTAFAWGNACKRRGIKKGTWKEKWVKEIIGKFYAFIPAVLSLITLYFVYQQKFNSASSLLGWTRISFIFLAFFFLYSLFVSYGPTVRWFFQKFTRYFYIAFLYIFLLIFVFKQVEQADAFFIELFYYGVEDKKYLLLFTIYILPTSLIIVWYLPYYLYFSKTFYSGILSNFASLTPESNKKLRETFFNNRLRYYLNLFLPVRTLYDDEKDVLIYLKNYNNERDNPDDKYFHRARRIIGIIYILSFIWIFSNLLTKAGMDQWYVKNGLVVGILVVLFYYLFTVIMMCRLKYNNGKRRFEVYRKNRGVCFRNDGNIIGQRLRAGKKISTSIAKLLSQHPVVTLYTPLILFGIFYYFSYSGMYQNDVNAYTILLSVIGLLLLIAFIYFCKKKGNPYREVEWDIIPIKGTFHAMVTFFLFAFTFYLLLKIKGFSGEDEWELANKYLIYLYFFLLSFMSFAFYRRFSRDYEYENQKVINFFVRLIDEAFTPLMMLSILMMAIIFICSFFGSLFHFHSIVKDNIHSLKTINIFFIFANGFFAFIAIIHRTFILGNQRANNKIIFRNKPYDEYQGLVINTPVEIEFDPIEEEASIDKNNQTGEGENGDSTQQQQFEKVKILKTESQKSNRLKVKFFMTENPRFFILSLIYSVLAIGIYFSFEGTNYHTLHYVENDTSNPINLETYTQRFLERMDTSKPIVLIASDGGGVKAAYWTLRVLQNLDKELADFYINNVFITSGASGGSIGLGMYAYLNAQKLENQNKVKKSDSNVIESGIESIGGINFLNADLTGMMTRWPIKMFPAAFVNSSWIDRMDLMSQQYFEITHDTTNPDFSHEVISKKPFSYIWEKTNYQLPLYIMNTAQMEEGRKGIAHPLDPSSTNGLLTGMIELSKNSANNYINFPDALFTTNRFPIISPKAKIEGKGHFFDVGAIENSGIETILKFLDYMQASQNINQDIIYKEFFEQKILLISIRSAKSRYIYDNFCEFKENIDLTPEKSNTTALISAVSNDGMTGNPRYYDDILKDEIYRKGGYGLDAFITVNIPFRITGKEKDVEAVLGGPIMNYKKRAEIKEFIHYLDSININSVIKENNIIFKSTRKDSMPYFLEPALGRVISKPSKDYMDVMSKEQTKEIINYWRRN